MTLIEAMSFSETALLGALAGFTIYLGLPVGRLALVSARMRVALAMFSVGDPGLPAGGRARARLRDRGGRASPSSRRATASFGHAAGLVPAARRRLRARQRRPRDPRAPPAHRRSAAADRRRLHRGARAADQPGARRDAVAARARALQTGLIIAMAIGVHNLAEGLAIGVSARVRRDRAGDRAGDRLRPAQRDRGLRHRRAAGRRHSRPGVGWAWPA